MKWQAHGVAFQVHPALVLMGAVALWLGEGETLIAFAPALLIILLFVIGATILSVHAPAKRIRGMSITDTINEL